MSYTNKNECGCLFQLGVISSTANEEGRMICAKCGADLGPSGWEVKKDRRL